jgi:hypothetical protein
MPYALRVQPSAFRSKCFALSAFSLKDALRFARSAFSFQLKMLCAFSFQLIHVTSERELAPVHSAIDKTLNP